jgi:hypothetical protein
MTRIISHGGKRRPLYIIAGCAALLVTACSPAPRVAKLPDIPVNIVFDGNCPVAVQPPTPVDVSKAADQRIKWQSVNGAGEPIDREYEIFFDPFKGSPLKSNAKGFRRSPKISGETPVNVEYKYSVRGKGCDKDAYDPRFVVR